jgi:serine/threonine protein kinase
LARDKKTQHYYAIKTIAKHRILDHKEMKHARSERDILATLAKIQHPYLMRLLYSFQDDEQLYLVLDYHHGGDIANEMVRLQRFDEDRVRFYACEIISGIAELHRHGIIYRDLKPENILIAKDGHLVLTDFGLSKQFSEAALNDSQVAEPEQPMRFLPGGYGTQTNKNYTDTLPMPYQPVKPVRTNTFCGTAEYLAPELLRGEDYGYAVDWWSLGTLLYEMIFGITPFWDDNHAAMYRRILYDPLSFPGPISEEARSLLKGLLERDPRRRLGYGTADARSVQAHPFFAGVDWEAVAKKQTPSPYVPSVTGADDLSHFEAEFVRMTPQLSPVDPLMREIVAKRGQSETAHQYFDGFSFDQRGLAVNTAHATQSAEDDDDDDESIAYSEDNASSHTPIDMPRPVVSSPVSDGPMDPTSAQSSLAASSYGEVEIIEVKKINLALQRPLHGPHFISLTETEVATRPTVAEPSVPSTRRSTIRSGLSQQLASNARRQAVTSASSSWAHKQQEQTAGIYAAIGLDVNIDDASSLSMGSFMPPPPVVRPPSTDTIRATSSQMLMDQYPLEEEYVPYNGLSHEESMPSVVDDAERSMESEPYRKYGFFKHRTLQYDSEEEDGEDEEDNDDSGVSVHSANRVLSSSDASSSRPCSLDRTIALTLNTPPDHSATLSFSEVVDTEERFPFAAVMERGLSMTSPVPSHFLHHYTAASFYSSDAGFSLSHSAASPFSYSHYLTMSTTSLPADHTCRTGLYATSQDHLLHHSLTNEHHSPLAYYATSVNLPRQQWC